MIDLVCYLLDGTPCGPNSFAESLEMCRAAIQEGIRTIVATPRWEVGRTEPPLPFEECNRKVERLTAETQGRLSVRLGFVLHFNSDLLALVERYNSKLTLGGGRYLLISLSALASLAKTEDAWDQLARRNFSVLLTRPECNLALRRNPARLEGWVERGVMLQLDAASVIGSHGRDVQQFARQCIQKYEHGVIVSRNAHNSHQWLSSLGRVRENLIKAFGAHRARLLLDETPKLILSSDKKSDKQIPTPRSSQNFFQQLLGAKKKAFETT